jgi:hypothetical protein
MSTEPRTHPLNQSSLYKITRRSKLARLVGLTDSQLRYLSKNSGRLYREKDVPKKDGEGLRHIEDPAQLLKVTQRRIAEILAKITPPNFLYCPVKRRCYVTNAAQHRENRAVKSLDIKKYFPNTKAQRVFWFFETIMKCERDIAATITNLACFNGHLPTGSPLSPILAFYAHYDMWTKISTVCDHHALTLTVYIDDITISGTKVPESAMWEIKQAIHGTGLRYHKEKAFFDQPAEVTGVFVDGAKLTAPHKQFKKLRDAEAASNSAKGQIAEYKAKQKIAGLTGQLAQIRAVAMRG